MLNLSIQSHVYSKSQTWICTTWPNCPFSCPTKVYSLNHSKRAKILLSKVAKFYTDVFMVGGKFVPPPPPHYTNVCVKFRHFVRAVPSSLVSIQLKLIILRVFFQPWCWIFAKWSQSKAAKIWVHVGPFDIDVRKVTIRYNETNLPKCLRSIN